jgi:DNA processing protein
MDERTAYIALNMMEQIGPVGVRSLVARLGSAAAIFEADRAALCTADGIGPKVADAIVRQRRELRVEDELELAERHGCRLVAQLDPEYPAALREIHDPPLALYVRGELHSRDCHAIAVVGTRRASLYGIDCARKLAHQLAQAGFTILSGLARGIDTAAHQGALQANGRTVAVVGGGLGEIYPPENGELAARIAGQGAVVSEFPMQRKPDKTTFPMRNRIVSGMSRGVLVVEAGRRSGAAITAEQALQQGRDVFAVPGRIDSYASQGANDLIKSGAPLVSTVDDILGYYDLLIPLPRPATGGASDGTAAQRPRPELTADESALVGFVENGVTDVDGLIRASELGSARVGALLVALELKRVLRALPGRQVALIG